MIAAIAGLMMPTIGALADETEGEAAREAPRNQWALLIGVEKYYRASPLRFTVNDVEQLAATLKNYGGWSPKHIRQITDNAPNPRRQPLRSSILAELSEWLKLPEPNDQVLVYFSGHGFRDDNGKLYLAPIDCDPENPAATGIAVETFHEAIRECRAKFKLLVLDACHAGSEKGPEDGGVTADELGRPFEKLPDVLTLASSSAEQQSQIWEEKQQSLFSYWLNYGLKGHADIDGDGAVDVDELFKFVHGGVTRTADARFAKPQEPVRIVHPNRVGVPVVLRMKPQRLKNVLTDMAEQLADALADRGFKRVGVLEFTNDTPLGELLGANFGGLGKYCSDELEQRLTQFAAQRFGVIDRRSLERALKTERFGVDKLGSPTALQRLSRQVQGGMPVVAVGTLCSRARSAVRLQCKLIDTETDEAVLSVGGVAEINESEWAMLGGSALVTPAVYQVEIPDADRPTPFRFASRVEKLDQLAREAHPMLDKKFPYRVKIMIEGQERPGVFRGNELFVPMRVGEEYEVWIENLSGRIVLMRLLVDGLNTLPQKPQKGVRVESIGARVNLDEARHWVLDPAIRKTMYFRGFVTQTGPQGEVRKFKIVDAESSLAARRKFTDNIGLITAAFYADAGVARGGLGTAPGEARREDLTERAGTKVGNLLAVVNIRYVEASALEGNQ